VFSEKSISVASDSFLHQGELVNAVFKTTGKLRKKLPFWSRGLLDYRMSLKNSGKHFQNNPVYLLIWVGTIHWRRGYARSFSFLQLQMLQLDHLGYIKHFFRPQRKRRILRHLQRKLLKYQRRLLNFLHRQLQRKMLRHQKKQQQHQRRLLRLNKRLKFHYRRTSQSRNLML